MSAFGLLNIAKPAGLTSRKVVDRVAKLVRPAKAGHAGTLDPLATGVLVVCVGPATRLMTYVQQQPKTYEACFLLGRRSETDDIEGEVVEVPCRAIDRAEIESQLPAFVGRIEQVPPRFSAVHVDGQRAYDRARRGEEIELAPRPVDVYSIELLDCAWPELRLRIECGSGTYIRSIGRDLGERLGCGAVMSALVRTAIGPFRIEEAVEFDALDADTLARSLQPALTAVAHLPRLTANEGELAALGHGRAIARSDLPAMAGDAAVEVAVVDSQGCLAALAEPRPALSQLAPKHVFIGK